MRVQDIFYPAFGALVSPEQNIFSPLHTFFTLCLPIAQKPRQAVVLGRLSRNMCLWVRGEHILPFAILSSPFHLAFTVKGQCNMTFFNLKLFQMARLIHYPV